ncbi:ABC transporter substrate-binding protein [Verticiella sediminum]|uniref:ABC transporter substrate-binding protein n=1 Tax=Verticiella sediminum TaxID=1247510 RepID=A0A556ACV4_9BURK|nr:ABC transporter substrate-binding protein [Verticiella sediminum]TSH90715.1 ABC transporter substrate-binding protein [Verticiella sediminum]
MAQTRRFHQQPENHPDMPYPDDPTDLARRRILQAAMLAPMLYGLDAAAQTAPAAAPGAEPVRGGTLITAIYPAPNQLNVTFNNQYANSAVSSNIFDGLFTYDDAQNAHGVLATSWDVSPDGLAITLNLRQGVKWHDGEPFTSADVRYSILEVLKKVHPRARITFSAVEDVETPDAHTAVLRLSRPAPVILNSLNTVEAQIIPRHLYEGTDVRTNPYNAKPVGTGPFRFKEWRKGQYVELERNPDYWDEGKPYLDRVIFRDIPDPAGRAAALETGDIQYLPFAGVPFSDVERLRKQEDLVFEQRGYVYNAQIYFLMFNLKRPVTGNLKVRQAFAHALDKQGLIDTVWYGLSRPADGPIPSTLTRFYTEDKPAYAYDPALAEKLLDEAGFPRKENGIRFSLQLDLSPSSNAFVPAGEFLRQNLRKVGIDVRPVSSEPSAYLKKIWTDYDYDVIINGFSTLFDPEMGLTRQYWSKAVSPGVPYISATGYANAETDRIIEAYQREIDPAKRTALFHDLQRVTMADLPLLPVMDAPFFTLYNRRVHGLDFDPDGSRSSFRNVWLSK